jgi:hypothetical protein
MDGWLKAAITEAVCGKVQKITRKMNVLAHNACLGQSVHSDIGKSAGYDEQGH